MSPTIYKDECVYTCDTTTSPHGIDVCLTCFLGLSPDPAHNFTAAHQRLSGHTAFLNIRKIPKTNPEVVPSPEIQEPDAKRLHIRDDSGESEYTEVFTFKTLESDDESSFVNQISQVKSADSYARAKQTEEWQLELTPCEHVAMYESVFDEAVNRRMTSEQLSHCSDCDLKSNLWLCLHCGNLGCGRRQFDGSGGNGHALQHFEQCGEEHALAAKLGSITPEGHVDVYCYACNDDKLDPNIGKHLASWGIDIAKQTKTEKSMTELQLEQNMNWDFSAINGDEPVHGPGLTGMKNLGNSCYMNSVMQTLFKIPEFAAAFPANDPEADHLGAPESVLTQLRKIQDGLDSGRYEVVNPAMLKSVLGKDHAEFATARQQDAFEYFTHVLSLISRAQKNVNEVSGQHDLPTELFGFQTERRLACNGCSAVRYINENQENLSIGVPIEEDGEGKFRAVDFTELLDLYTREENVELTCPRCGHTQAKTSLRFKSFPQVLVLNVRRFRVVNWVPQKVDVPITMPSKLVLDKYLSPGPAENEDILSEAEVAELSSAAAPADEYTPSEEQLAMLMSMGFDLDLCSAGLSLAHERGIPEDDLETVINLVISGEAAEYAQKKAAKNRSSGPVQTPVNPDSVAMLESMGFDSQQATISLQHNQGRVDAAIEWLFAGKYEEALQNEQQEAINESNTATQMVLGRADLPAVFELQSTICHKGASVHVGHYVAAVREKGTNILYNDERVTLGSYSDELEKFGYVYLFRRI